VRAIQVPVDVRLKPTAGLGAYGSGSRISLDEVAEFERRQRWLKAQDWYARLSAGDPTGLESASPADLRGRAGRAGRGQSGRTRWIRGQNRWVRGQ